MIIYNKTWLNNFYIVRQLEVDYEGGYISKEELASVRQHYPVVFYLPKIAGKVGFFILTLIAAILSSGLISLMAASGNFIDSPYWCLFLSVAFYIGTEGMTRANNYFHSGIDNALLYFSAGLFAAAMVWLFNDPREGGLGYIPMFFLLLIAALWLTIRFADVLMAAGSCICFFALVYFTWVKLGSFGMATMPFVMIIAAAFAYFMLTRIGRGNRYTYYQTCIDTARATALVILYLAGNYFVVNKLNNILHGLDDSNTQVQLGFFFWAWTMLMPVLLIASGIRSKSRLLLRLGVVIVAAALATFRNYYQLLPIELMLTLGGAILLLLAYTVINYLKKPKHGITSAELEKATDWDKLNLEGFVIGQTASPVHTTNKGHQTPFGGGTGGGAGSSGSF